MNDPESIAVDISFLEDGVLLAPKGEIDLSRSPALRQTITRVQEDRPRRLVIDLSGVPYMDSSGVATLIEAMRTAQESDGQLIICGLQDKVRSIFEIARLDMVFTIAETCEEAVST